MLTIITTCTKKKTSTPHAYLRANEVFTTQEELLAYWKTLLESCPESRKQPANALYRGRGFRRIQHLLGRVKADLFIISAGLGLVKPEDQLVPYNLTTSVGSDNHVKNHIASGQFSAEDWWNGINDVPHKLAQVVKETKGLVVIGVSRSYLEMISADLVTLDETDLARVRLVGNELEETGDFSLFENIMPYDARLNLDTSPYPGSKIDYAQRAVEHFVQCVLKDDAKGSAKEHATRVFELMQSYGTVEQAQKRGAVDDLEIRRLLIEEWDANFGKPTRLLQVIRKKYHLSCSEKRLFRIVDEIRQDKEAGLSLTEEVQEPEEVEA